jgi:ribosomal protein L24
MPNDPKFDYGDEVQVASGEHKGRVGCIVCINLSAPSGAYTVELAMGVMLRSKGRCCRESQVNECKRWFQQLSARTMV